MSLHRHERRKLSTNHAVPAFHWHVVTSALTVHLAPRSAGQSTCASWVVSCTLSFYIWGQLYFTFEYFEAAKQKQQLLPSTFDGTLKQYIILSFNLQTRSVTLLCFPKADVFRRLLPLLLHPSWRQAFAHHTFEARLKPSAIRSSQCFPLTNESASHPIPQMLRVPFRL